jgi:hypothetical protein
VQKPLAHWLSVEQMFPPASLPTQSPEEHQSLAAQSASTRQSPLQAVAPQA